ncbi:hypothetical protein [Natribacillus halophilus]|uniref:Uncharacterized protein n=1 Tax=Natribacillus halophilus TaxID=549003 RepID=A0A1G8L1R5_9BACI|nr:hypothetical protein [Natribacillus halophilus]SDI49588.1 hypothetical protein SAMN04488123_102437 [Natribacillus halophilus]
MTKQRVTYTWKINTERNPESINEWLDAQSNIRDSLSFLVQVMQERFGNVDVRDIEASKELLQFMHHQETKNEEKDPVTEREQSAPERDTQENMSTEEDFEQETGGDDIFSGIDDKAIFTRR